MATRFSPAVGLTVAFSARHCRVHLSVYLLICFLVVGCSLHGADHPRSSPSVAQTPQPGVPADVKVVAERQLTFDPVYDAANSWSPDGRFVLFSRTVTTLTPRSHEDSGLGIYVMESDGHNIRTLISGSGNNWGGAWSPDGTKILFASNRSGNYDVWLADHNGRHLKQLTTDEFDDLYPAWSPDGAKIYFISNRSGEVAIWRMEPSGANQAQISTGGEGDWIPSVSPDGKWIAFGSPRPPQSGRIGPAPALRKDTRLDTVVASGLGHIWIVSTEGSEYRQLTQGDGNDWAPKWSPDGEKIVFVRGPRGSRDVWIMDGDGSHQMALTEGPADDNHPHWSPDGAKIVFSSKRTGYKNVWLLELERMPR